MVVVAVTSIIIIRNVQESGSQKLKDSVIGTLGNREIHGWEFDYFKSVVSDEWESANPGKQPDKAHLRKEILSRLTSYVIESQKAEEEGVQLSEQEKLSIWGMISDNDNKLSKQDRYIHWPKNVFGSVTQEQLFEIESNKERISKLFNKINFDGKNVTAELKKIYEMNKESYRIDRRFKVKKIVIKQQRDNEEKPPALVEKAYKEALINKEFENVVVQYSTEQPVRDSKGDDFIMEGASDDTVYAAIHGLKKNEITRPIKVQEYWVIYKLIDIIPPSYRAFNDADTQKSLTTLLKIQRIEDLKQEWKKEPDIEYDDDLITNLVS